MTLRCLVCAAYGISSQAFAEPLPRQLDTLGINHLDPYITGRHARPVGAIDPYTGEELSFGQSAPTEYTAPYMSYLRTQQDDASNAGLTYQVVRGVSLRMDPNTGRLDTDMNLTGDHKRKLRLNLKPEQVKAVFTYKWN